MRSMGWLSPFRARPWAEIAASYHEISSARPAHGYLAAIADSVLSAELSGLLAGSTALGDLIVVDRPVPRAPSGAVVVSGPWSRWPASVPGWVRIEHVGPAGEVVECAVAEAVPVFWQVVARKFGVAPVARVS